MTGPVAGASRAAIGVAAERAVVEFLLVEGCEILGTNVRVGRYELDVIAQLDDVILVVEVRFRGAGAWVSAFGSVDSKKRARVRAAAERLWDRKLKYDGRAQRLRFDTASVCFDAGGSPHVEYVPAAF
jgi:putative endonuclease